MKAGSVFKPCRFSLPEVRSHQASLPRNEKALSTIDAPGRAIDTSHTVALLGSFPNYLCWLLLGAAIPQTRRTDGSWSKYMRTSGSLEGILNLVLANYPLFKYLDSLGYAWFLESNPAAP